MGANGGQAQLTDESGHAQFGDCAEAFGDRVGPDAAKVHYVEMVAAGPAHVLLDLAA